MTRIEWIPVNEKMPEPCEYVLCFVKIADATRRLRAFYAAEKSVELDPEVEPWGGCTEDENGDWWVEPGWYEANEYEDTHWRIAGKVTHWMPLPEPPDMQTCGEHRPATVK